MAYLLRGGRKNYIRNGDMSIYQRGSGPFTVHGLYGIDGWYQTFNGGTVSTTRVAPVVGTSGTMRTVTTGQTLAAHYVQINHSIEDLGQFPTGKTLMLSFKAKANTGTPKIGIRLSAMPDNVGTGAVDIHTSLVTISTTLTTYIVPITLGSHSSSLGNGNHLRLTLWLSAGSNYTAPAGVGLQNNTFDLTDIQLEDGSVATPFERIPQAEQLAWCQRYFQRIGDANPNMPNSTWIPLGTGLADPNMGTYYLLPLAQAMRKIPTTVSSDDTKFTVYGNGIPNRPLTAMYADAHTTTMLCVSGTMSDPYPAFGDSIMLMPTTGGWIDCSAEI